MSYFPKLNKISNNDLSNLEVLSMGFPRSYDNEWPLQSSCRIKEYDFTSFGMVMKCFETHEIGRKETTGGPIIDIRDGSNIGINSSIIRGVSINDLPEDIIKLISSDVKKILKDWNELRGLE